MKRRELFKGLIALVVARNDALMRNLREQNELVAKIDRLIKDRDAV